MGKGKVPERSARKATNNLRIPPKPPRAMAGSNSAKGFKYANPSGLTLESDLRNPLEH
jgi:hypothetical protein